MNSVTSPKANGTAFSLWVVGLWALTAVDLYGPYRFFRLHAFFECLLFATSFHCALVFPQPARVLPRDSARGPLGLNFPGEHGQDLAEGQIRIPDARIGVAVAGDGKQSGVCILGTPRKLFDQCRFAPPGARGTRCKGRWRR